MSETPVEKDAIDEKVERIVERGVLIPPELKADFLIIYRAKQDEIRTRIAELMKVRLPGVSDHESDAIAAYMRQWVDELRRQDSLVNYQQLMLLQGFEPVDEETFRTFTQEPVFYRKYRRGMRMPTPDRVANRNCIRERWDIFRQRKFTIGGTVEYDIDRKKFRVKAINERAMLVLESLEDGTATVVSPHKCRRIPSPEANE